MILKGIFGKTPEEDEWEEDSSYEDEEEEVSAPPSVPLSKKDRALMREMVLRARAFADYYNQKLATAVNLLNDLDREIFQLLPVLVHLDIPGLPGYFGQGPDMPGGIQDFQVDQEAMNLLIKHLPSARINANNVKRGGSECAIRSLAVMGSIGSIAQTSKSDFDIWVCVNKSDFTPAQLDILKQKLQRIEKWADAKNHFECHFFITDIDEVKENTFGAADTESAGSALGKLLKEEFYRTHTLLAGLPPLWTAMPTNVSDEEYARLRDLAFNSYHLDQKKFIDLGNAQSITPEEAFGASLWQLNKALHSPFKSAMKMALIEDYMDPNSDAVLLCDRLKETVFRMGAKSNKGSRKIALHPTTRLEENPERLRLDSYIIMFHRILDFYKRLGRNDLIDILRKCFYLKAGVTLSGLNDSNRQKDPKKDMVGDVIAEWGWSDSEILDLNSFKKWPFEKSITFSRQVNGFIIDSYKRLSKAGQTTKLRINPTDLTVLGRKLFTFYSRKKFKVEFLPKAFEESLHQEHLTFTFTPTNTPGELLWRVFRSSLSQGDVNQPEAERQLLKKSPNLVEILAWLGINGIWDRNTHLSLLSLQAKNLPLTAVEMQDLLAVLLDFFSTDQFHDLSNEDLTSESHIKKVLALINYGDLKIAGRINRVEVVYNTSWGEIFYERGPTGGGMADALRFIFGHLPRNFEDVSEVLKVYVPSGRAGQANRLLYREFEHCFHEMSDFFNSPSAVPGMARTFIFQGDPRVYSLTWDEKELRASQYGSIDDCFLRLELKSFQRNEIHVSESPTKLLVQQAMMPHLQQDTIQVFAYDDLVRVRVYISDELGGTSFINLPRKEWEFYGAKLYLFLETVIQKLEAEPRRVQEKMLTPALAFYNVVAAGPHRDRFQVHEATEEYFRRSRSARAQAENLILLDEKSESGKPVMTFQMGGTTFSSEEYGPRVFNAVAAHIYKNRETRLKYPIFITELHLPEGFRAKNCPDGARSVHYILYKNMVERKLNQALQAL